MQLTTIALFGGFYGSYWEFDMDYVCEIQEESLNWSDIDLVAYEERVADHILDYVVENCEFVQKAMFESIEKPRFYNFTNDVLYAKVEVDIPTLQKYITNNKEKFSEYLKERFTSHSGFHSFYSNSFDFWQKATKDFTVFPDHNYLGSVIEFALLNEGYTEYDCFQEFEPFYNEYVK